MHQIRQISKRMLQEKLKENHATEMEGERKKDIMSLLVRGRKESLASEPSGYALSDEAMMDQVVRVFFFSCYCFALKQHFVKLTFLGAGHETTASGLAWVSRRENLFFLFVRTWLSFRLYTSLQWIKKLRTNSVQRSHLYWKSILDLNTERSKNYSGSIMSCTDWFYIVYRSLTRNPTTEWRVYVFFHLFRWRSGK